MFSHDERMQAKGLSPKRDSSDWILGELDGAAAQDKLRALERSVQAPHPRTGGPLANFTYSELEERLASAADDETRAWSDRFDESQRKRDRYPLDYLRKHLSGCREFARLFLRDERLAGAVHERARTGTWPNEVTSRRLDRPAPVDGTASTLAALWSGASWWPGRASQRRTALRFFGDGRTGFHSEKFEL